MGVVGVVSTGHKGFQIVRGLNDEWAGLSENSGRSVARWAERHPALAGCTLLDEVLNAAVADSDPVLLALLTELHDGDELAGRTVLQQLLGRIVVMALRDAVAEVDDYVAALWCRIRTYPLQTRPHKIAANLALDCLKVVKRELRWAGPEIHVATLPPGPLLEHASHSHGGLDPDHGNDPAGLTATSVITAADLLGLIDVQTRAVLLSVYSEGLSGRAAADRHETSPAMIRLRCSKAVRHLAQHAVQLAEVA